MPEPHVTGEIIHSPIFRIRGQRSRWRYPHERLTPETARRMRNVNISELGTADRRRGYTRFDGETNISENKAVVGMRQAKFSSTGTQQFYVTETKVYAGRNAEGTQKDITGSVSLTGGVDDRVRTAFLLDSIVATNGKNATFTWNGNYDTPANAAVLGGSPPWSTCRDVVAHGNVLVVLNTIESVGGSDTKFPTRLRWSDINTRTFEPDITSWIADNRTEIAEMSGDIIGGVDNWDRLFVFKEDGLYTGRIIYDMGNLEYKHEDVVKGFSPVATHSLLARPEFVWGVAKEGAFIIRRDLSLEIVTLDVQDEWEKLKQGRLQYAVSAIREKDHQIRTLLSSADDDTSHDLILVYDWETGDVWFDKPKDKLNYITNYRDPSTGVEYEWVGSYNTFHTYLMNKGTSDDASGIDWEIQMAPNDLGYPGIAKQIYKLHTIYNTTGVIHTVTLDVERDEGSRQIRSSNLTLGTTLQYDQGHKYGAGLRYQGIAGLKKRFMVNRSAETISPQWSGTGDISLIGYQVEFAIAEGQGG